VKHRAFEEKTTEFVRNHRLFEPEDNVLVACSGGPDSVALLLVLNNLSDLLKISISVVHINHNLRFESENDAEFTKNLAVKLGLPFFLSKIDIKKSGNLEENARDSRHMAIQSILVESKMDVIALGHTASDRAETVLHNLARGSGMAGVGTMQPKSGNIVRPLLFATRNEVIDYLKHNDQIFVTDATNANIDFSRNRIRHHIISELEQIFPQTQANIARFAQISSEESDFLDEIAKQRITEFFDGNKISISKFKLLPKVMMRRSIRLICLDDYSPSLSTIDDAIKFILESEPGKQLCVSKLTFSKVSKDYIEIKPLRDKHRSI